MLALSIVAYFASSTARAAQALPQVELQLVVHDKPDTTVDKMERQHPIATPVSTGHGVEMKTVGLDLSCWARNIRLDDKSIFERYFEGKYVDRLPIARAELAPGDHTIWPGKHVFTVNKDGTISTKSEYLIVDKNVVRIKCYPVTVRAFIANPEEGDAPLAMRIAPLPNMTIREAGNSEQNAASKDKKNPELRELLPYGDAFKATDKFAPLTLWLPANSAEKGYVLYPSGLTFHLGADGVAGGAGNGQTVSGIRIDKFLIEVPLYNYTVTGADGCKLVIPSLEELSWRRDDNEKKAGMYPRAEPYELKLAEMGASLFIDGNFSTLPFKSIAVDGGDPIIGGQRCVVAELSSRHLKPGAELKARVRALDTRNGSAAHKMKIAARAKLDDASRAAAAAQNTAAQAENAFKTAQAAAAKAQKAAEADAASEPLQAAAAAAKAQVELAQKALDDAKEKATGAAKAAKEAAGIFDAQTAEALKSAEGNPLESAPAFAQIQAYGETTWTDLKLQPAPNGEVVVSIPELPNNVYRLRLGVRPPEGASIAADQWVSLAGPKTASIGMFTQRGRQAFYRGESFWISLGAISSESIAAGAPIELDLIDERGTRLALVREKTKTAITGRDTFVLKIDGAASLALAPGRYRAEAKLGALASRPLNLEISDPEPRTHFSNCLVGKYNSQGDKYQRVIRSCKGTEELAAEIAALGFNAFIGMSYDMNRISRQGAEIEQLVRERPELGPWESYYQPTGRDRFMDACVRHNLRFYENLFTYHDCMLPREPRILDACERYTCLETASMRHSPAFFGDCLYDEFYDTGDNDAPQSVVAAFFKSQEMAYRDKHPGMTSADAIRSMERFVSRPAGQRRVEDLQKFRGWPAHQDSDWRVFSERMAGGAKTVFPKSQNLTLHRLWGGNGGNLATNGVPEDVFDSLDVAATVMYKDGGMGDRPVFGPMAADSERSRDGLPVWVQLHDNHAPGIYSKHVLRQAFFSLSQKVEGFTYFCLNHDEDAPSLNDTVDTVHDIAGHLTTRYGDWLTSLDKGYKKVAIFYSREADFLAAHKPNNLCMTCEGLWVSCVRAGFPADFIYDRQLKAGRGKDYDVIFVPGITYEEECPPETLAALRALISAGKTILVERGSKLPLEGVVRLNSDLDEYDDKLGGSFPRNVDFEFEMVFDQSELTTKLLREILPKYIQPAAQHNLLVGPDWLRAGKGEFMLIPNFADTGFSGMHKTLYQAPDAPMLKFPKRPPFCYDVLEMKPVPVATEGDLMSVKADMRSVPGKILAFLPASIGGVQLKASSSVQSGSTLNYQVAVTDNASNVIDAAFPLQITLLTATGQVLHEIYRSARPEYRGAYVIPINLPGGTASLKLRVRELIGGTLSESTISVNAGTAPTASVSAAAVRIGDLAQLKTFMSAKQAPMIVLEDEQKWCRDQAERLRAALQTRGLQAKIVTAEEAIRLPAPWDKVPALDGTRLWRGDVVEPGVFVDAPLILVGKRNENRLIEALIRRDAVSEPLTANFPSAGGALVGWTRHAFSNQFDTVYVLANDESGLGRGIDALLAIDAQSETATVRIPLVTAQPDPNAALTAGSASSSDSSPDVENGYRERISGEDLIRSLDVDAATGRVLVGTFGFGDNLFCFGPDGKLLWKKFLPEHNVYFVRWYDDGKRVVAATGEGHFVFLLNGADGVVNKKFASTEWPLFHGGFTVYQEGGLNTEVQIEVNAPLRQILIAGLTGPMAVDYDGKKIWFHDRAEAIAAYPPDAEQTNAAEFGRTVVAGHFALNKDGTQLIYGEDRVIGSTIHMKTPVLLWAFRPAVMDARTGRILYENSEDPGNQTGTGQWSVAWPEDSPNPRIQTGRLAATLNADNKLDPYRPLRGRPLKKDGFWGSGPHYAERFDAKTQLKWRNDDRLVWLSELDTLNVPQTRLYRCAHDGLVRCVDMDNGKTLWEHKLPFSAKLHPVGDELLVGANNGYLARLDAAGKVLWQTRLREHHQLPESDYAGYVHAALRRDPDSSSDIFPVGLDRPNDYNSVLRMGIEQLVNGDFATPDNWQAGAGKLRFQPAAHSGKTALALDAGALATQDIKRRIIPSATYLLEFFYRVEDGKTGLTAGVVLGGAKETFTGSKFMGRPGEWTFGRLAIKSMEAATTMQVGFEASGGTVLVSGASLKPIRFPSANLLANSALHAIEPTFVGDIRVQYDRIPGALRQSLMSQNHVVSFKQGGTNSSMIPTQEQAFLQNGRLDDVGPIWTYQPDIIGFSATLKKTAWVSHLVLYLNNSTPDNVYETLSILANNVQTKLPELVGMVRCNRRRFIVVHFPKPIFTDSIKILPGMHRVHRECLTEIELYGPLGGPDESGGSSGKIASKDSDAVPMFMGTPSHVPAQLPADLTGPYRDLPGLRADNPIYHSGATVVDGVFSFSEPNGSIMSFTLPAPGDKNQRLNQSTAWTIGTLTPTTTPARYAGRLIAGSADGKMHAVSDSNTHLWSFQTGGRIYSSPCPVGDDVYFGSDDGHLYKVDVDSGAMIWEFTTGDKIRSAPAFDGKLIFAASWDGFLHAIQGETGFPAWKAPLAKFTRSSPAIHLASKKIFIGDESGVARCFDAEKGTQIWEQKIGGYISNCPVIAGDSVFFVSEQGDAALLALDGTPRWKRQLGSRITGQPLATQTQILVPTETGLMVLKQSDGQTDERFIPPTRDPGQRENPSQVLSALIYKNQLFLQFGGARTNFNVPPRTYAEYRGSAAVWVPGEAIAPAPPKRKK